MAQYQYVGLSWQGAKVKGSVEAYSESEAMLRIHDTCKVVLKLRKSHRKKGAASWDTVEEDEKKSVLDMRVGGYKLNLKVFSVMCNQFAVILRSGMPVARAVQMVGESLPDRTLQKWLKQVLRDVEGGGRLAESMENRGGDFLPKTFVETIRAGEASGNLDRSFENMAKHFETEARIRAQVKSAMGYPILLLIVGALVMGVITLYVIPMFTQIFEAAGAEMPPLTKIVIGISQFIQHKWWVILAAFAGLYAAYRFVKSFERGEVLIARICLMLPVIGPICLYNAASQFMGTLGTLIGSGLTINDACEITCNVVSNAYMKKKLSEVAPLLQRGSTLADAIRAQDIFPVMLEEMTAMGESSGEIEATLNFMGNYYEKELEAATSSAIKKLGPAMLVLIGGAAIFMIVGIYSGMFGMYDAFSSAMVA